MTVYLKNGCIPYVYDLCLIPFLDGHGRLWIKSFESSVRKAACRFQAATAKHKLSVAAFSRRGDCVAVADSKGSVFLLLLMKNRFRQVARLKSACAAIAFTFWKNTVLVAALRDRQHSVVVIDTETGAERSRMLGHKSDVSHISFHKLSSHMLTVSHDSAILWNTSSWARCRTIAGGPGILSAQFSNDGGSIWILYVDSTLRCVRVGDGEFVAHVDVVGSSGATGLCTSFALSQVLYCPHLLFPRFHAGIWAHNHAVPPCLA